MSTIRDVAKIAGVSVATVSNAMTNNRCVNVDTRNKVIKIAKQLKYTPNLIASSMVTKKTNIFGVFLYDYAPKNFLAYSEFLSGVVNKCQQRGQRVLLYTDVTEDNLYSSFLHGREPIDGGIIFFPQADEFRANFLKNASIPFVFVGKSKGEDFCYVDAENDKIAYNMTKLLLEAGHKKLAFFNTNAKWQISIDRMEGFSRAVAEYGLKISDSYIYNSNNNQKEDEAALKKILERGYKAILSESPIIVEKIYKLAEQKSFIIGKDMSVAFLGYDYKFDFVKPSLTCAKLQYDILGENAAEILSNNISNEIQRKKFLLESKIIMGESIAKL